jgi:hypothetical protein
LIFKILTSKKTRKVAKKAVKVAKKNVKVRASDRGLDILVMNREILRLQAESFKRFEKVEEPALPEWARSIPHV